MRAIVPILLVSGCTFIADLDGQRCDSDADCADGRSCSANNYCLLDVEDPGSLECSSADPCEGSDLCVQGQCVSAETARWGCVDDAPAAAVESSQQVALRLRLQRLDGSDTSPVASATVSACEFATCEAPLGPFQVDGSGSVDVMVPQGFTGFVSVTGDSLLDTLYQLQAPLNADESAPLPVTLLGESDVSSLAAAAGETAEVDSTAWVLFQLFDCTGAPTGDVAIGAVEDEVAQVAYLSAPGTPVSDATSTDDAGLGFAGGGTGGSAQFNFARQSTGDTLGAVSVATAPGTVTVVPYQLGR